MQAEVYIQQGRVTVNGRPAALGTRQTPKKTPLPWMENRRCSPMPGTVLMLYKPRGW